MSAETTEAKVKDAKYDTATIQEAIMWLQENLPTQSIKGNSHCSPNAKLFYMKRFKCFDNYAVITTTTQTEIRAEVREVLEDSSAINFLDLLDEDDIPQASDVILILSQYVASMEIFHKEHYGLYNSEYQWVIK